MARFTGTSGADRLRGTNSSDVLDGLVGNDHLDGRGGNDVLLGGIGLDLLIGGAGNDSYTIDDAREIKKSTADTGIDTVKSSVTYTLGIEQENLVLLGSKALNGTGNLNANVITGNTGNNKLAGGGGDDTLKDGKGNDTLTGGDGNDRLLGEAGNDILIFDALDTRGTDGGAGTDTLRITGATTADLVALNAVSEILSNLEVLDLNASGAQTVFLNPATVLGLSATTDTLKINGTADDTVQLDGVWTTLGDIGNYHQFQSGSAIVQILSGVITKLAPVAGADALSVDEGASAADVTATLLANDSDPNPGDTPIITAINTTGTLGQVILTAGVVTYNPNGQFEALGFGASAADTFSYTLSDGTLTATTTVTVTVNGVNDAPTNVLPATQNASLLQNKVLAGISVGDVDIGSSPLSITLSTNLGTLSLSQVTGLTFTVGDGGQDESLSFTGTLSHVNAALNNLVLHATQTGSASITLISNDQSAGGALSDTDSFTVNVSANAELSTLDGKNGAEFDGEGLDDHAGFAVSSAGDVNGDGLDDLLIGSDGADDGVGYVVFGKASGFSAAFNLSALDGTTGFRINAEASVGSGSDYAGTAVSAAGDVDGDGFADLLIGAWGRDTNGDSAGASYVLFGHASPFSATVELSALDGNSGFEINGTAADDFSGLALSNAGDLNGDGFDDLLIGAGGRDVNDFEAGSTYVVFGSDQPFAANLNLASLNGVNGFQLNGEVDVVGGGDRSGVAVSSAGDVNGDGFDDLLIGAQGRDVNGNGYIGKRLGVQHHGRGLQDPGLGGDEPRGRGHGNTGIVIVLIGQGHVVRIERRIIRIGTGHRPQQDAKANVTIGTGIVDPGHRHGLWGIPICRRERQSGCRWGFFGKVTAGHFNNDIRAW